MSEYVDFELFHPSDSKRSQVIRFVPRMDSGMTLYTVLPEEICQIVGEPAKTFIQLVSYEGAPSEVELWAIGIRYKDKKCITLAVPSKNENIILGLLTLAQLGLTHRLTQIKVYDDHIFSTFIYGYAYDVFESLYETKEALDVYREVLKQYNEDWIEILANDRERLLLKEWRRSALVVWFMSMYLYSMHTAIVTLLVGLYPYTAVALRQALEGLITAYVADTCRDYIEIRDPLLRWDAVFNEFEKTSFKNAVERYFDNDKDIVNEILSLWKELSRLFVHARGLVYTFQEVSSITMGLPLSAYVNGDKESLLRLSSSIKSFRKIFKKLFDKWSIIWLQKHVHDIK